MECSCNLSYLENNSFNNTYSNQLSLYYENYDYAPFVVETSKKQNKILQDITNQNIIFVNDQKAEHFLSKKLSLKQNDSNILGKNNKLGSSDDCKTTLYTKEKQDIYSKVNMRNTQQIITSLPNFKDILNDSIIEKRAIDKIDREKRKIGKYHKSISSKNNRFNNMGKSIEIEED